MAYSARTKDGQSISADALWLSVIDEIRSEYLSEAQRYPWIVGFSGGKDSTVVTHAIFEALLQVSPSRRVRPIHIVSNDTLVESPLVLSHLDSVVGRIATAADGLSLPISVVRTNPDPDKTFWVLLIGKGYPSPNSSMRWCTDRLKILPTSTYIKREVSASGAAVVVLGVRHDESQSRSRNIVKTPNARGTKLSLHDRLPGAFIYRPIANMSVEDVWEVLATHNAPWGGDHSALIKLYRDSDGGECPVVLSTDEAPGCGTPNSRFGCWTCTVVEKDKSLQGFVDSGKHHFKPLIEFRDWLRSIRNNPEMRQVTRRNGRLTFNSDGKHIPGPFTMKARQEILSRLLRTQESFGAELISNAEMNAIYSIWAEELVDGGSLADV